MSNRQGRIKVERMSQQLRDQMIDEFKEVEYFSATSDMWSRQNKSFIAVTVHFIDKNYQIQSRFIACELFQGNHTHDRVAEKVARIFQRFQISEKVFFITTDGAGEYVAAIKYFGNNSKSLQAIANDPNDWPDDYDDLPPDHKENLEHEQSESDDEEYIQVPSCPSLGETFTVHDVSELKLPNTNRIACSSHLFNHLAKDDSLKARTDRAYATIYDQVFDKLEAIWKVKDSRLNTEIFQKITGYKLVAPHRIRWLKTFDSVSDVFVIFVGN